MPFLFSLSDAGFLRMGKDFYYISFKWNSLDIAAKLFSWHNTSLSMQSGHRKWFALVSFLPIFPAVQYDFFSNTSYLQQILTFLYIFSLICAPLPDFIHDRVLLGLT